MGVIDDHSRLCVAAKAFAQVKAADVVSTFYEAVKDFGLPASLLSDNGAVFTAAPRNGRCAIESELLALGIIYKHSRPYHPQTCGKVERFHQTLKKHLRPSRAGLARGPAGADRPLHRLLQRTAPASGDRAQDTAEAYAARMKAAPRGNARPQARHYRVRHDKSTPAGPSRCATKPAPPRRARRRQQGPARLILLADRDVRVLSVEGEILRQLVLDPSRDYQPLD